MSRGIFVGGLFAILSVAAVAGCSDTVSGQGTSSTGETCDVGSEDCECYGNGSCDSGLSCDEGFCIEQGEDSTGLGGAASGGTGDEGTGGDGTADGTGGDGTGGSFAGDCDKQGLVEVDVLALEGTPSLVYLHSTATSGAGAQLRLEIYYNLGAPSGPYEFMEWENYQTCSTCALIYDCPDITSPSYASCTIYEVDSGTLDVTTNAGGTGTGAFAATLTDIFAREVTVDEENSFSTTPVADGLTWCIDSLDIDVVTQ